MLPTDPGWQPHPGRGCRGHTGHGVEQVRSPQAADGAVRSVNAADLISPCGVRPATPARPDKSARPACRPHTLSRRTVGGSSLRNHRTCRPCAARCSDALRSAPPRGGERPWARGSHRRCARRIPRAGRPGLATAIPLFFAPPRDPAVTRWCLEQQRLFPVGAHPRARKAITSFAHNARMQSPWATQL
jgi:hypothetical protein